MNKLLIPTILVATVLVAGFFALTPVYQASTVHTTITASLDGLGIKTQTVDANPTDTVATEAGVLVNNFALPAGTLAFLVTGEVVASAGTAANDDLQILITDDSGNTILLATVDLVTDTLNTGVPFSTGTEIVINPTDSIDITLTVIDAAEAGAVTATVDIDLVVKTFT